MSYLFLSYIVSHIPKHRNSFSENIFGKNDIKALTSEIPMC